MLAELSPQVQLDPASTDVLIRRPGSRGDAGEIDLALTTGTRSCWCLPTFAWPELIAVMQKDLPNGREQRTILGALVFDHTAIGWIAGTFFGSIILLQAIKPGAAARLGRNHPRLDGAFLGLPLFFGLAVLTPIPLWICAVIGVVGIAVGVALGCSPAATADNRPEVIGVKPASQGTGWE